MKILTMLLALSTGQRVQTLSVIYFKNIRSYNEDIEIKITQRIKLLVSIYINQFCFWHIIPLILTKAIHMRRHVRGHRRGMGNYNLYYLFGRGRHIIMIDFT